MISDKQIIQQLRDYGYLHGKINPATPVDMLSVKDADVKAALRQYQDFCYYPLNGLVRERHGRDLIIDGDIGPATRDLFSMPRCQVPDFGPRARPALTGTGSWPKPCQKEGIKYLINTAGIPSSLVAAWPNVVADVVEAYRLIGLKLVPANASSEVNIYTHFGSFFGSTIGLSEFNNESCGDRVDCKLSSSYVGENRGLLKHEWGHNCNLGHTRGGTMNPYILDEPDPAARWLPTDPSYQTLVRYFDGVPVGEPGPTVPPVTPPPKQPPTYGPFLSFLRRLFGLD